MSLLIPKQVDIEVSTLCQLRCQGCPMGGTAASGGFMDLALFKSIIDRIDFETTVVLWLNGEPLLHPHYAEMAKYVEAAGLRYYITTNGMIWNEELFELITNKDSFCYQIIFSLDGLPWSPSIEIARPGTDRVRVLKTIEGFGKLKSSKQAPIDMAVKICQRGQDWEEIENYIGHWLEKPFVDYVCYGKMLNEETAGGQRTYPCQYFDHNFLILGIDGTSRLCAYNTGICNGANPVGKLGETESLLEFYNNEAFTKYRRDQRNGIFHGPCETCGFAYTGFGSQGILQFRNPLLRHLKPVYFRQDYYNQFYSLKEKGKPMEYYL